jgi:hypothetical protein
MLAVAWPVSWVLFLPIVLLEASIAHRTLRSSWPTSLKLAGAANLLSTLLGIPLAWLGVLALQLAVMATLPPLRSPWILVPLYAAWLPPMTAARPWLIPLAAAALCVPCFLVSVWIEGKVALGFKGFDPVEVRRWAWRANLCSYGLLVPGLLVMALLQALHLS